MTDDSHNRRQTDRELVQIRTIQESLSKDFQRLERQVEASLLGLKNDVEELKDFLRGGSDGTEDPFATRLHQVENGVLENRNVTRTLQFLIEGSVLDKSNSLLSRIETALSTAKAAKEIAEGREQSKTARRGQLFTLIGSGLFFLGTILVGIFANWEKLPWTPKKQQDPVAYAEHLRQEIETLRTSRGPEVEKKLKEIEDMARNIRRGR